MDAPARQLDFWVGEWDVYDPDGKHVGRSRIESTTGGRVILENWSGDGGLVGSSMNFYDAEDGRWHQVWVDARGGVLRFAGSYADGALRYAGESTLPGGGRQRERLTFAPLAGGRVHQLWEQSQDDGRSWTVAFDGTYVPHQDVAAVEPAPA